VSAEVSYNRRWFQGAKVTDNTLRTGADYEPFAIVVPQDSRLPGAGGYPITLNMLTALGVSSSRNARQCQSAPP
jgi:hypothetical protein